MPKVDSVSVWIKPYKELRIDMEKVYCAACEKIITCQKKFQIDQHIKTASHVAKLAKMKVPGQKVQLPLLKCLEGSSKKSNEQEVFNEDLCRALLASNIPLSKLSNENFSSFLQKYCKMNIPHDRTLRRNNTDSLYSTVLIRIKEEIGSNYFYVCVDETTDSSGRYIAHLMIGALTEHSPSNSHLISVKQLQKTNALTITRFVQDELAKFFLPEAVPNDKLLLFLSDAAPYMVKAVQNIKIFYPRVVHVTCLAHGMNRVAEEVRKQFPLVNELISVVKKVFLKAPLRIQYYKEILPNTPLPPQPVITRWGTWLEAACFYTEHYASLKQVISEFSDEASQAILDAKKLLDNEILQQQLTFIKGNYNFLAKTITQLESQILPLVESINIVKRADSLCRVVSGNVGRKIEAKLKMVLDKNDGFNFLSKVARVLSGNFEENFTIQPHVVVNLKYAPLTSVDVERSFSIYKHMYSDRRHTFLLENFEKHLIVYCFYNSKRNV